MKNFKFELQKNEYSLEINNCIDYKIAGALSIFEKEYFKYYCAFWTIYRNWLKISEDEIRERICKIFGFEIVSESIANDDIIKKIEKSIDHEEPILLFVCSSTLFFSVMFKEDISNFLGHVLLITGYDDLRKLVFIRENSINKELMNLYVKANPLFQYQLTYDMIINIINKNNEIINDYENLCFFKVRRRENVDLSKIKTVFYSEFSEIMKNGKDNLINEIEHIIKNKTYNKTIFDQQFHRTYINSYEPLFDVLEENKNLRENKKYIEVKSIFMQNRNKVVSMICKNAYKGVMVEIDDLNLYIEKIKYSNNDFFNYLKNFNFNLNQGNSNKNQNLLFIKGVKIITDSEKVIINNEKMSNSVLTFSANSFLKKSVLEGGTDFWISNDKNNEHWLKVIFPYSCLVNKIVIEHSKFKNSITSDFSVLISDNDTDWNEIFNVVDNQSVINNFEVANMKAKYILIKIIKPNRLLEKIAVIRKLYIYGKLEN